MTSPTKRTAAMKLTAQSFITPHMKKARKLPPPAPKTQPVLSPPSVELAPAFHTAPPVAFDLLMDKKLALTVPEDFDNVCDAAVAEPMVNSLPACPLAFQLTKNVVAPAGNNIEVAPVAP